jgi:hypothetical protein
VPVFDTFAQLLLRRNRGTFNTSALVSAMPSPSARNSIKREYKRKKMATSEQYFNLVRTSKSSWIAVPAHQANSSPDGTIYSREPESAILRNAAPAPGRLFAQATGTQVRFPERFPRLTIAMIAFALFTISVTAEVELLRHAGYFWR